MLSDIEINQKAKKEKINKIAKKLNISNKYLECYGNYKAKINLSIMKKIEDNKDGKLILVTSTNPTPYGEGKTTMSIGLTDALCNKYEHGLFVYSEDGKMPMVIRNGKPMTDSLTQSFSIDWTPGEMPNINIEQVAGTWEGDENCN